MKSLICIILFLLMLVVLTMTIVKVVRADYQYSREIGSYWNLADKASTITQKSQYIDQFVTALEAQGFSGEYNAILFPTPDNSFDKNMEALRSLQWRLREIQSMNPASFEYQTAIQQITAQEQGEAQSMLNELEGVWWKRNHFFFWDWIGLLNFLLQVVVICTLGTLIFVWWDD